MFKLLVGVTIGIVFSRPILSLADKTFGGTTERIVDKTLSGVANAANRLATKLDSYTAGEPR